MTVGDFSYCLRLILEIKIHIVYNKRNSINIDRIFLISIFEKVVGYE